MTTVAFVGARLYYEACSLTAPAGGLVPHFVDHKGGADPAPMLRALAALDPDVIVVFRPEIVPPGAFDGLRALTLGFNTEPLPRGGDVHPDQLWRLSELAQTDPTQFDRIITFDPLSAAAAEGHFDVWRCLPLPVDDRIYRDPVPAPHPPRVLFLGYSTEHRERWLLDVKHHFDVLHVAYGVHGDRLRELFGRVDVAINLHGEPYPSFENRICLHLAAAHLVLSEPLSPTHGLEPGIDFVEVTTPRTLLEAVLGVKVSPDLYAAIRRRGRRKAEQFRASRMWPRVIDDLQRDVAAFGTGRRRVATA